MNIINPPLKIQGKKTKLIPDIQKLAEEIILNNSNIDTWVEPFMGSGIVAFNCPKQIKHVVCGDINPHVIEFYKGIQSGLIEAENVRKWLKEEVSPKFLEGGKEMYLSVRDEFNRTKDVSLFFVLSRTGYNGVMRFNKKGEWNLPFCNVPGILTDNLIDRVCDEISQLKKLFSEKEFVFLCQSYEETLKLANEHSIVYCDPPYYGLYTTYYNDWSREFEINLRHELDNIKSHVIISTWKHNAKCENEMIDQYWSDYSIKLIEHQYIVGPKKENRPKVIEALLYKCYTKKNKE